MAALIDEQKKKWQKQFFTLVQINGKISLEQAVRCLRKFFRTEYNILMEIK